MNNLEKQYPKLDLDRVGAITADLYQMAVREEAMAIGPIEKAMWEERTKLGMEIMKSKKLPPEVVEERFENLKVIEIKAIRLFEQKLFGNLNYNFLENPKRLTAIFKANGVDLPVTGLEQEAISEEHLSKYWMLWAHINKLGIESKGIAQLQKRGGNALEKRKQGQDFIVNRLDKVPFKLSQGYFEIETAPGDAPESLRLIWEIQAGLNQMYGMHLKTDGVYSPELEILLDEVNSGIHPQLEEYQNPYKRCFSFYEKEKFQEEIDKQPKSFDDAVKALVAYTPILEQLKSMEITDYSSEEYRKQLEILSKGVKDSYLGQVFLTLELRHNPNFFYQYSLISELSRLNVINTLGWHGVPNSKRFQQDQQEETDRFDRMLYELLIHKENA